MGRLWVDVAEADPAVEKQAAAVLRKKRLHVSSVTDRKGLVEAVATQEKLLPVERTVSPLDEPLRDRGRVRAWLNTPHPDLGGRTALSVILEGNATIVAEMLEAAAAGLPA